MKDFANKLKKILKKRNISQSELARGVKLSRSSISHYVNGNIEPTHNNVVAIARYLKVPVSYFIDTDETDNVDDAYNIFTGKNALSILAFEYMINSTKNKEIYWERDKSYPNLFVTKNSDLTEIGIGYERENNRDFYLLTLDDDVALKIEFDENNESVLKLKELYEKVEYLDNIYPKTTAEGITVTDTDDYKVDLLEKTIHLTRLVKIYWTRCESNPNEFATKIGKTSVSITYEREDNYEFYTFKIDDVPWKYKFYENDLFTLKLKELYEEISSPEYFVRKLEELNYDIDKILESTDKVNETVERKKEELKKRKED